jgi:hypothetical protein
MADCANKAKNLEACGCTYAACGKRGVCCDCIASHRARDELPGCLFPPEAERTYDRSVRYFVEIMQDRVS